jgi:chemotaxis methyl-accepting protein methylase
VSEAREAREALDDAEAFMALTAKIARDRGFSATSYKDGCLRRRIAVRMRACGAESYESYSGVLDRDAGEYDKLIDALTINVTKLFRNAEAWEELARTVFPALWSLPSTLIHCWVAGCSSGEEAYTLAAMWHQFATAKGETAGLTRVRITASDIDAASLESAAAGHYAPDAFAEVPAKIRERYFTPEAEGRSAAVSELRSMIRFERRDLLRDAPPRGPVHLITCRNVIIYFDRPSQEALMQRFHDALTANGYLMLGKVETLLGPTRTLFNVIDQRQRVFQRA